MGATVAGKYGTQISLAGNLFGGSLTGYFAQLGADIEQTLADDGKALVSAQLKANLRHPTGHYQGKIQVTTIEKHKSVWDQRVVYGPWLEGTGSRNKTTRFKGYSSFRKATQQLDQAAPHLVQAVVDAFVAKMNA